MYVNFLQIGLHALQISEQQLASVLGFGVAVRCLDIDQQCD